MFGDDMEIRKNTKCKLEGKEMLKELNQIKTKWVSPSGIVFVCLHDLKFGYRECEIVYIPER